MILQEIYNSNVSLPLTVNWGARGGTHVGWNKKKSNSPIPGVPDQSILGALLFVIMSKVPARS